jgi:hypothetical protein
MAFEIENYDIYLVMDYIAREPKFVLKATCF